MVHCTLDYGPPPTGREIRESNALAHNSPGSGSGYFSGSAVSNTTTSGY